MRIGVVLLPAPTSATVADPPPLEAMVTVAFLTPAVAGENVTFAVVDAPPARVVAAGLSTVKLAAPAPVITNGVVSVTGKAVALVIVSACDGAEVVTGTTPKSSDGGAAVMTVGCTTVIVNGALPVQPLLAVARTVNVNGPRAVGVPVMLPSVPRPRPVGSAPPLSVNA